MCSLWSTLTSFILLPDNLAGTHTGMLCAFSVQFLSAILQEQWYICQSVTTSQQLGLQVLYHLSHLLLFIANLTLLLQAITPISTAGCHRLQHCSSMHRQTALRTPSAMQLILIEALALKQACTTTCLQAYPQISSLMQQDRVLLR